MLFTSPFLNLYIKRGIIDNMSSTFAITVFSGSQPTAANITSSWSSYNTTSLIHWTGAAWTQPNADTFDQGNYCYVNNVLTATAHATGTATWGILWRSNVTLATVQGATLPDTVFITGTVTTALSNGIIKLSNTSITSGQSYSPLEVKISLSLAP